VAVQTQQEIELDGLSNGRKVHIRAVALNALHESAPGPEYPIYITNQSPPAPDGLHVDLAKGAATITWGEVLGVSEYRLYTRARWEKDFHLLYKGGTRIYVHKRPEILACSAIPDVSLRASIPSIFEYAIVAVNGNDEGAMSSTADTDPAGIIGIPSLANPFAVSTVILRILHRCPVSSLATIRIDAVSMSCVTLPKWHGRNSSFMLYWREQYGNIHEPKQIVPNDPRLAPI
jgi:hypothetical protein